MDGGSKLYGGKYKFHRIECNDILAVKNAIYYLLTAEHNYKTLIIDPITVYWEELQRYWSEVFKKRLPGSAGHKHEFYDVGPKEWNTIKSDYKALFNKLVMLDMNVIVTARESVKYAETGFMRRDGVKFDCEKNTPYHFDTVIQLFRDEEKYMGYCTKDRSSSLPQGKNFQISYSFLAEKFGIKTK